MAEYRTFKVRVPVKNAGERYVRVTDVGLHQDTQNTGEVLWWGWETTSVVRATMFKHKDEALSLARHIVDVTASADVAYIVEQVRTVDDNDGDCETFRGESRAEK